MNSSKFNICLVLILFSLTSCLTNVDEETTVGDPNNNSDPCKDITFSMNVKPIIDNNCIQCHTTGGQPPNLTTYAGVSANAATVKAEVVSKDMPVGGSLTDEEIQAISCWVDAGAQNN